MSCSSSEDLEANPLVSEPIDPAPSAIAIRASPTAAPTPLSLLGLPAELRNAIYTYSLVVPDPILIVWGHSYRQLSDGNPGLVATPELLGECRAVPQFFSSDILRLDWRLKRDGETSKLVRVALPGLALLATCRQIYHEASSIFLSNCKFTISRPSCEHIKDLPYLEANHRHDGHGQIFAESADWLVHGIGSQLPKLQRLAIDISALCTPERRYMGTEAFLELLPLLRVLWNRAWNGKVELCFATGLAQNRPLCQRNHITSPESGELDAENLTKMLESLRQDEFGIRKFERTMSHVAISRKSLYGFAIFRSTCPGPCPNVTHKYQSQEHELIDDYIGLHICPCLQHRLEFGHHSNSGATYTKPPVSELLNLPSEIRWQIFRHCLFTPQVISVDLDDIKAQLPGVIYLTRGLHYQAFCRYYAANHFSLRMKVEVSGPELINLNALDSWMSSGDFSRRQHALGRKGQNVQSIILDVDSSRAPGLLTLPDIRINAAVLRRQCHQLSHIPTSVGIHVRTTSNLAGGCEDLSTEGYFSFREMNLKVERVLLRLLDEDWGLQGTDDLEIVVNGHGDPVGYVYPGSAKVLYGKPPDYR